MCWACRAPIEPAGSAVTTGFARAHLADIRRGFVAVGDLDVHYRACGADDLPPLVMFHGSPGSSFSLVPQARRLARGRRVIAFDTPGNGDSTPLSTAEPTIGELAEVLARAIDGLGIETFDLYGYHTGTGIATEVSLAHPGRVGRIVLDGVSMFTEADRAWLFGHDHAPEIAIDHDGTQLLKAWSMVRDAHIFWPWWNRTPEGLRGRGLPSADYLHGETVEVLRAATTYHLSYRAALRYPKRERLPLIRHPCLVTAAPRDQLYASLDAAAAIIPGAVAKVVPGIDTEEDAAATAEVLLAFLENDGD